MAYVIVSRRCGREKAARCVAVCPVSCIHPDPRKPEEEVAFDRAISLYIDPAACIDCHVCVPECPSNAIFPEDEVPEGYEDAVRENREFFKRG